MKCEQFFIQYMENDEDFIDYMIDLYYSREPFIEDKLWVFFKSKASDYRIELSDKDTWDYTDFFYIFLLNNRLDMYAAR